MSIAPPDPRHLLIRLSPQRRPARAPEPGPACPRLPAERVASGCGLGEGSMMQSFEGAGAPLARQMAKLLANSDLDELQEVVRRWVAEAATDRVRHQYDEFGKKLLELKRALASAPQQPSEEELELALTMMLKLAAQGSGPLPDR